MITYQSRTTNKSANDMPIGKRVVLLGTSATGTQYNFTPVRVKSLHEFTSMFGKSGSLYDAYNDILKTGISDVYVHRVEYIGDETTERTDMTNVFNSKSEAYTNGVETICMIDFDVCVLCGLYFCSEDKNIIINIDNITKKDSNGNDVLNDKNEPIILGDIVSTISSLNTTSLFLIPTKEAYYMSEADINSNSYLINNTALQSKVAYNTWKSEIDYLYESISSACTLNVGRTNISVITNNAIFYTSDSIIYSEQNFTTNVAAYFAGLLVTDFTVHPTRVSTIFTDCSDNPFYYRLYDVVWDINSTPQDSDYDIPIHVTSGYSDDGKFAIDNLYTGDVKLRRTLNGPYAEVINPSSVKMAYFKKTKSRGIVATNFVTLY